MPDQPKLTPAQGRAVEALLSSRSIAEAARQSKVSERSIFRWLSEDPLFQDKLAEARRGALAQASTRLHQVAGTAVEAIHELIQSEKRIEPGRASLVRTALDFAFRAGAYEDVRRRLDQLEQEAEQESK